MYPAYPTTSNTRSEAALSDTWTGARGSADEYNRTAPAVPVPVPTTRNPSPRRSHAGRVRYPGESTRRARRPYLVERLTDRDASDTSRRGRHCDVDDVKLGERRRV